MTAGKNNLLLFLVGVATGAIGMFLLYGVGTAREYAQTVTLENQIKDQLRAAFEEHGQYPESLDDMRFTWDMEDPGPQGTKDLLQNVFYKSLTTNYVLWRARFPAEKGMRFFPNDNR